MPKENLLPVVSVETVERYMEENARLDKELGWQSLIDRNPELFRAGTSCAIASGKVLSFMSGFILAVDLLETQAAADALADVERASK